MGTQADAKTHHEFVGDPTWTALRDSGLYPRPMLEERPVRAIRLARILGVLPTTVKNVFAKDPTFGEMRLPGRHPAYCERMSLEWAKAHPQQLHAAYARMDKKRVKATTFQRPRVVAASATKKPEVTKLVARTDSWNGSKLRGSANDPVALLHSLSARLGTVTRMLGELAARVDAIEKRQLRHCKQIQETCTRARSIDAMCENVEEWTQKLHEDLTK